MFNINNKINYDFLYDKEFYGESLHRNHFSSKTLRFRVIENCCVTPSGIVTPQDTNELCFCRRHETVIYLGNFRGVWGHFLTNHMSRLWFLKSRDYHENFSECKLIYSRDVTFKLKGNYKRMFEILDIDCSKFEAITESVQYDKVILPDESFFTLENIYVFTSEYKAMIDHVREFALTHIKPVKSQKIYFSYFWYRKGRIIGEDKLEKYFASKGYKIIHPEKLSLDEQLNILINCESFASTIGSCSHNIIFLKDNTEVILIPRICDMNIFQDALDQVHNLRINYIDSSFSIFCGKIVWGGPFLCFISNNLRKFFHDENPESIVNAADFIKYLRISFGFSMSRAVSRADSPTTYRYYSAIAPDYFSRLFDSSWLVKIKKRLKSIKTLKKFFNIITGK